MDRVGIWLGALVAVLIAGAALVFVYKDHYAAPSVEDQGGIVMLLEADRQRDRALKVMKRRVDEICMAGASVEPQGETNILVKLPGMTDAERTRRFLLRTARLEFKIVDDRSDFFEGLREKLPEGIGIDSGSYAGKDGQPVTTAHLIAVGEDGKDRLQDFIKDVEIPADREIALSPAYTPQGVTFRAYLLHSAAPLTGAHIEGASAQADEHTGQPEVSLDFDAAGAEIFEKLTGDHIRERLAIVLEGEVSSAPVIQDRISGGRARLSLSTGKGYQEALLEAKDLAAVLRAGALPASISVVEERVIKPASEQSQ